MPTIKEKKPSGLVFSLCKMSALVRMTERTAIGGFSIDTGVGGLLYSLPEGAGRGLCPPAPTMYFVKVGTRGAEGRSVAPHAFLRKLTCKPVSLSDIAFPPGGTAEHVVFIVPFSFLKGCL